MKKIDLVLHGLASLAAQGNIFSNDPKFAGAVAAAQNLQALARKLQSGSHSEIVSQGTLYANGKSLGGVSVAADGFIAFAPLKALQLPDDTSWSLKLTGSRAEIKVRRLECEPVFGGDGLTFVVADAETFYDVLLKDDK